MKLPKFVLAALVLGLAGCSTTDSNMKPVNCVGLIEQGDTMQTVNLYAVKTVNGVDQYKVAGYNATRSNPWRPVTSFYAVDCYDL